MAVTKSPPIDGSPSGDESTLRRVEVALRRARAAVESGDTPRRSSCAPRHVVAIGDPQSSTKKLLEILAQGELIAEDGWLRPDVRLVSMGDYFDYGSAEHREEATRSGLESLAWLAAHSADQVTLIVGNHDLARVGELVATSDERFGEAVLHATRLYRGSTRSESEDAAFLRRFPEFPSVEVAARDLSTFSEAQRALVVRLLEARRFRLAACMHGVLFTHAGVTRRELRELGVVDGGSEDVADRLQSAFETAVSAWSGSEPLGLPGLHQPGSAANGEGGGMLFHRPSEPIGDPSDFQGPARRRFDPRDLPSGIVQAIGHVRDAKCRKLMPSWTDDASPPREGRLRHLWTDGTHVEYAVGTGRLRDVASILFLDGGMNHVETRDYELLDVVERAPYVGRS